MKKQLATLACSCLLAAGTAFAFSAAPAEAAPQCPSGPGVYYVSHDPNMCFIINYDCPEGMQAFSSDCGCGCQPVREW